MKYTIDDVRELIGSKSKDDIILTNHGKTRCKKRKINEEYVKECIINKIPLGNLQTSNNTFRLIYNHEKNKSMDLHIVVAITRYEDIRVVTVFPKKRSWREHEKEK